MRARMEEAGELPLPPYLGRTEEPTDRDRYQTIFAGPLGAAAAPTAGLHFTPEVLGRRIEEELRLAVPPERPAGVR